MSCSTNWLEFLCSSAGSICGNRNGKRAQQLLVPCRWIERHTLQEYQKLVSKLQENDISSLRIQPLLWMLCTRWVVCRETPFETQSTSSLGRLLATNTRMVASFTFYDVFVMVFVSFIWAGSHSKRQQGAARQKVRRGLVK